MLANFVQETANAPGTTATINLGGAAAGRLPFVPTFASGSTVFYGMDDGTQAEMGIGTVTSGSPNTLARNTVLWNTAGTTARMNFLGTVRVYCAVPSERSVYTNGAGDLQGVTAAKLRDAAGATTTGAAVLTAADAAAARTAIAALGLGGGTLTGALVAPALLMLAQGGVEGGEIALEQAPSSALNGDLVLIDQVNNEIRIFESGLPNRGVILDLTQCASGASSSIWHQGNLTPASIGAAPNPVGMIAFFVGSSAPTGWIKANGAPVSRTTYADLFAHADATGLVSEANWIAGDSGRYSEGDGSTTIRVPDLRGEFLRGWDDSRGVDSGRNTGTRQAQQVQSHTHTASVPAGSGIAAGGTNSLSGGSMQNLTTSSTGGAETRPRNVSLLACIKY